MVYREIVRKSSESMCTDNQAILSIRMPLLYVIWLKNLLRKRCEYNKIISNESFYIKVVVNMKIFISHSSKDKNIANAFSNFLESVAPSVEVFCSSQIGSIKVGHDFVKIITGA